MNRKLLEVTNNNNDSLSQICETLGPEYSTKLIEAVAKVGTIASAELDLSGGVSARDLSSLGAVRDFVLGAVDELNIDRALEQVAALPGVAKRLSGQAEAERVQNAHAKAIERMSPGERMSYARKHGLTSPEAAQPRNELTAEEQRRLDGIKTPALKMALARKYGLEK